MNTDRGFDRMNRIFRMRAPGRRKASSLVVTLLVIVVLSTIVVAFMQSMAVERLTAKSAGNRLRAEHALKSGLNHAINNIANLTTNHTYNVVSVVSNDASYLFIGHPLGGSNTNTIYSPLFSGGLTQTSSITQLPTIELNPTLQVATNKPSQFPHHPVPTVSWITIPYTNSDVTRSLRFCYSVYDLEGTLDISKVGNTNGPTGNHSRETNNTTSAIGLFTLFSPTNHNDPGNTIARDIVQNRESLLTAQSILQFDATQTNALASLSANRGVYVEPELIPTGFGYQDEGKPKYAINVELDEQASVAVQNISQIIRNNLPDFDSIRKGGFDRGDYVETVAANIVDYTDIDNNPTLGPGFRGVDSYPFVNLIYSRYAWISGNGTIGNPVTIEVQTFVDLWNPSSKATSGIVNISVNNSNGLIIGLLQNFGTESYPDFNVNIPPNGHAVINLGTTTYQFINGTGVTGVAAPLLWKDMSNNYSTTFTMTWNGNPVDEFRGGARRTGSNNGSFLNSGQSQRKYQGNAVALDYSIGQTGDPRASYYIDTFVFDRSYDDNTAWGGRQFSSGINNTNYKEVRFSRWPDPSNDGPNYPSVTSELTSGNDASQAAVESPPPSATSPWFTPNNGRGTWRGFGDGTLPTSISLPTALTNLAPAIISNSGKITNICELGNIYDPSQWRNITNTNATASVTAGGGYSLRIGQPDFPPFSRQGGRASQLLDLFTVEQIRTNAGLVNINTATFDSLRALAAGILFQNNGNLQPSNRTIYPPRSANGKAADRFGEAIISSRPFISSAQMAHMTNSIGFYFGNLSQWGSTNESPTMWNDSTRERLFSELLPLVTTRSRNFQIFVSGQVLDKNGKVLSSANGVFHVFFEPDEIGAQTSVTPKIFYESSL